ncbi:MAG: pyridoxal-dependent decarboxylase [Gemmatales bacterium]|nr:pyridoxal-dependent decarboxylase [Gemmatales bacterium]MDW7994637.1 pyridoxal-dependent decarboxylase [Gemmatales bacterium]
MGSNPTPSAMDARDFRAWGHRLVDWIADYLENVEQYPVLSPVSPGEIRERLPKYAPELPESFEQIFTDFQKHLLPGITHWQSPNFYAFFPANNSYPSILGELLAAGLGVQGMLWQTSPTCTELETHVLDWLVNLLGLPEKFLSCSTGGGVIQDTASSATLCAVVAAREQASSGFTGQLGACPRLTAYASTEAHSSVEKALRIAGLGTASLRRIPVDKSLALRPEELERAIQTDRRNGFYPFLIVATLGTTSTLAFDPLRPIGDIARRYHLWLHVDAAMAGTAAICPEFRFFHDGLEFADSYCFNPHKWMGVNFDCDCFYVADRQALIRALRMVPDYLRNPASESGQVIDYRDWQIPLGRRFRALKLWFVLRAFGAEGIRSLVRRHIALARQFADWLQQDPRFEIVAPVTLNLVCFRLRGDDSLNQQFLQRLNATGSIYLSHTRVHDRFTLRFCVGNLRTQEHHVHQAWQLIHRVADSLVKR